MSVFFFLFAFVPLLHDQAAGQAVCPNKTWDPHRDRQWDRCIYYCREAGGSWSMGFFDDGTECRHTKAGDGVCKEGYCYKDTSTRSTRTPRKNRTKDSTTNTMPMTEVTGTKGTTTKRVKNTKKKPSSTLVPNNATTTEIIAETVPSTESTVTKDLSTQNETRKKKKPKKKDKKKKIKKTSTIANIEW